jgi:hypothetical protein
MIFLNILKKVIVYIALSLTLSACNSPSNLEEKTGLGGSFGENTSSSGGGVFAFSSVAPDRVHKNGGIRVTIRGNRFDANTQVWFDSTLCGSITFLNASTLTCVVPSLVVGEYDVSIDNGLQTLVIADGMTITDDLQVTDIGLNSNIATKQGPSTISHLVRLTGANFLSGTTIEFTTEAGSHSCSSVTLVAGGTGLTCMTPSYTEPAASLLLSAADITIRTPDGQVVTLVDGYTFLRPPKITGLTFSGGLVSAPPMDGVFINRLISGSTFTMTVNGSNFEIGTTGLTIAGLTAADCATVSSTAMTCTALPDIRSLGVAGNYLVIATNADGQSGNYSTFFAARPTVSAHSPITPSPAGDTLILTTLNAGTPSGVAIRNSASTAQLDTCAITNSYPITCTSPNLGTAPFSSTIRLTSQWGYYVDYGGVYFEIPNELVFDGYAPTLSFERVTLGSMREYDITVRNLTLGTTATGIAVDSSALLGTGFSHDVVNSTCGTTLAASSTCLMRFKYLPTQLEYVEDPIVPLQVTISYALGGATQTKSFRFKDTWSVPLEINMGSSRSFGDVSTGVNHAGRRPSLEQLIMLENRGTATVRVNVASSLIYTAGLVASNDFSFFGTGTYPGQSLGSVMDVDMCPSDADDGLGDGWASIPAGKSCLLVLSFRPASLGAKAATLRITTSGGFIRELAVSGSSTSSTRADCDPLAAEVGGGAGISNDPFLICSAAQLDYVMNQTQANGNIAATGVRARVAHYLLNENLTVLTPSSVMQDFGATFDGGGYTLTGTSNRGFFNGCSGTITLRRFKLYDVSHSFPGENELGGIIGNIGCTLDLQMVSFVGAVTGNQGIGGIVGAVYPYGSTMTMADLWAYTDLDGAGSNAPIVGQLGHGGGSSALLTAARIYGFGRAKGGSVGGVFGSMRFSTGTNINHAYSNIVSSLHGDWSGGIISYFGGAITASHLGFYGNLLNPNGSAVGGIVGNMEPSAGITTSFSRVFYRPGNLATNRVYDIGAYCSSGGLLFGVIGSTVTVTESYAQGKVLGVYCNAGGLASEIQGVVEDVFVLPRVLGNHDNVGGFAGTITGSVSRSYVAAFPFYSPISLHGSTPSDPFVRHAGSATLTTNYFLNGISPLGTAYAGVNGLPAASLENLSLTVLGFNDGVTNNNWKRASVYPYPILNWMSDDWMP